MCFLSSFYRVCMMSAGFVYATAVAGQKPPLVYFQTETNLPYTITWNGQTYASDPKGALVLRDMPSGEQSFLVDLGRDHGTGSGFRVQISEEPRAFSIRQLLNNRVQLFDLVSYDLINGTIQPEIKQTVVYHDPLDGFPQVAQPGKRVQEKNEPGTPDTKTNVVIQPAEKKADIQRSRIPVEVKKVFDLAGVDGIDQIYVVTDEGKTDTIALFIPVLGTQSPRPVAKLDQNRPRQKPVTGEALKPRNRFVLSHSL